MRLGTEARCEQHRFRVGNPGSNNSYVLSLDPAMSCLTLSIVYRFATSSQTGGNMVKVRCSITTQISDPRQ